MSNFCYFLCPLPYTVGSLNVSDLRPAVIRMCPFFSCPLSGNVTELKSTGANGCCSHTLACQPSTCCSDSLGPTVHAHARSICIALLGCYCEVPMKLFSCSRTTKHDVEMGFVILIELRQRSWV